MRNAFLCILVLLITVVTLSGCISITFDNTYETIRESWELESSQFTGGNIEITTKNGNVDILPWDKDYVKVEYEKKVTAPVNNEELKRLLDQTTVRIIEKGDSSLEIKGESPQLVTGSISIKLTVFLPKETNLTVKTSNGSINLNNNLVGNINFYTSNGRITVDKLEGNFELRTSNGPVYINEIIGEGNVKTSNANINFVTNKEIGNLQLETSNGSITFEAKEMKGTLYRFKSSNGNVSLILPEGLEFKIFGSTSNGNITTDFPIALEKNRISGQIGSGKVDISVDTSNGSIKLYKK